jgi:hypothetical protein
MCIHEVELPALLAVLGLFYVDRGVTRTLTVVPENKGRAAFSLNFFSISLRASCCVRGLVFWWWSDKQEQCKMGKKLFKAYIPSVCLFFRL